MNHSFNVEIATKYGMLEAVLLENINFWIAKNKANGNNFYDGFYWTYNSITALSKLFPYASRTTIFRALHNLEDAGLVIVGNYNKDSSDNTKWYALTKMGEFLLNGAEASPSENNITSENDVFQNETTPFQNETTPFQNETTPFQNETTPFQNETTLPDINTDINTVNNLTVSDDTVRPTEIQRDEFGQVIASWNSLAALGINGVSSIKPETKRYTMLRARINTYGLDKVLTAIENIKNSAFLCGSNKNGWAITFDWFIRPNNFIKVLEGNYDNTSRNRDSPKIKANQFNSFMDRGYNAENLNDLERKLLSG